MKTIKPRPGRCQICKRSVPKEKLIPVSPRGGCVCRSCFARQRLEMMA